MTDLVSSVFASLNIMFAWIHPKAPTDCELSAIL